MLMLWDIKEEYAHVDFYCEVSNVGLYDYLVIILCGFVVYHEKINTAQYFHF